MAHPVVRALRAYEWTAGQAAISDQTLAGLAGTPGVPIHVIEAHQATNAEWLAKLDRSHRAVMATLGHVE